MYSTCIFCHAALGANESVEHFPVGRRLAFDASRGRLWVVCRKCERWNLSPLEERWEAIEECERLFGETRLRVSTDNVGLARVRDGLELVRIGHPQRPEMAAWRYGDQFGRRRKRHLIWSSAGIAAAAGLIVLGPATGIIAGGAWGLVNVVNTANTLYQQRRVRARLAIPGRVEPVTIRRGHLMRIAFMPEGENWSLQIPYDVPGSDPMPLANGRFSRGPRWVAQERRARFHGDFALQAAAKLLPAINSTGAKRDEVADAVRMIGEAADPHSLFKQEAARAMTAPRRWRSDVSGAGRALASLPKEVRLALEMATHEESERRALEGELDVLETAWREAEEIAAIADDLFVPDETRARLAEIRRDTPAGEGESF